MQLLCLHFSPICKNNPLIPVILRYKLLSRNNLIGCSNHLLDSNLCLSLISIKPSYATESFKQSTSHPLHYATTLMLERQREGIEIARQKGLYKGRSTSINREAVMSDITNGLSVRKTAAKHEIAASSVSRIVKELKQ